MNGSMKVMGVLLLLGAVVLSPVNTFAKDVVKLSVKDDSEKGEDRSEEEKEHSNGDIYYVITETESEMVTLSVTAKNNTGSKVTCTLECYVIGENAKNDESEIAHYLTKDIVIEPNQALTEDIAVPAMTVTTVIDDRGYSDDKVSGYSYEGYIVFATYKNSVIGKKASSSRYLKDEWLGKCATKKRKSKK